MNLGFFDFLKSKVGGGNNGKLTPAAKKPEPATPAPASPTAPKVSRADLWRQCEALAKSPQILDRFAEDLKRSGVVGEERTAKLIYLALTSRWFSRPVSMAVKGPSSGGKSYTVQQVLKFFPADAYYDLTAMSERALAYSTEPVQHRFVVLYEAAGMKGQTASYLVRSLLSEGRLRYETVEKTKAGLQAKLIERPGPTGLITTTTLIGLHPENETRLLSVTVKDSAEQTAEILVAIGAERTSTIDLAPWHSLQAWLAAGERRITIPFGEQLAKLIPPVAVRLRRDFGALFTLIKAHAFLHQATRQRDAQGQIIATLDDYAAVRELVADLISEGVNASVSATIRETVQAVATLQADSPGGVSLPKLATALKIDKSAVSRRAKDAECRGYLVNLEDQKGKSARWVIGEPLPDDLEILPPSDKLEECCSVALTKGGIPE
ncbi:MAG TPA: hypothetical protein VK335_08380 [Bryobacteraceae bacterium]|nr:hypothetical protein [Bryobacteraceae bacterium]HXR15922.1 hypothetical protein [Terriglobales bacterium]HZW96128.1 hypothetical protein [Candidatus Eremiobacteraceae bacterium]